MATKTRVDNYRTRNADFIEAVAPGCLTVGMDREKLPGRRDRLPRAEEMALPENDFLRHLDDVLVAGGGAPRHRAWPALETTATGALALAYRESVDHHVTIQGVVCVSRSTDGGRTWSNPDPVAAAPGVISYCNHGLTRLGDESLMLPVIEGRPAEDGFWARARYTRSRDSGSTWERFGSVIDFDFIHPRGRGFPYGKIQELSDGRLMAPFYAVPRDTSGDNRRMVAMIFSNDGGETWDDYSFVYNEDSSEICPSETDVIGLEDGRYLAIMRANARNLLFRSYSGDEGGSWSSLEPTEMPGHCPALLQLRSGAILCAYRDRREGQPGLSCAVSCDRGLSWRILGHLYEGGNWDCAYPSLVAQADNHVLCAYYTSATERGGGLDCADRKGVRSVAAIEAIDHHVVYDNPTPQNSSRHGYFPGMVRLPSGDLLTLFVLGQAFEASDITTVVSRSADQGRTWMLEGPVHRKDEEHAHAADFLKPLLLQDGTLLATGYRFHRSDRDELLVNAETDGARDGDNLFCHSTDEGRTWTRPQILPRSRPEMIEASGPGIQLRSGSILGCGSLFPMWDGGAPSGKNGVIFRSEDGGKTWNDDTRLFVGLPDSCAPSEPRLCEMSDGRVVALAWISDHKAGVNLTNHAAVSHDGGLSWSPPIDTGITAQASNLIHWGGESYSCRCTAIEKGRTSESTFAWWISRTTSGEWSRRSTCGTMRRPCRWPTTRRWAQTSASGNPPCCGSMGTRSSPPTGRSKRGREGYAPTA